MPNERILVVEDEQDILDLLRYHLTREGFTVDGATSGEEGLKLARTYTPDLLLLDLMLPGIDGLEVCRRLKRDQSTDNVAILVLSAKGEESDVVTGLELGADDYVTKPFSPRVLLARVKALLRRRRTEPANEEEVIVIEQDAQPATRAAAEPEGAAAVPPSDPAVAPTDLGGEATKIAPDLVIHPGRFEVLVKGEPVRLTLTEFRVLHFLSRRPGWVFTRYQIVNAVKGPDYPVTERSVDVQIVGLRRKLGDVGHYIETVRGVGYRFREVGV